MSLTTRVALLAAVSSSSPGCDLLADKVRGDLLRNDLSNWLLDKGVLAEDAQCPEGEPVKTGHTFSCTCTIRGGSARIDVRVVDQKSVELEWTLPYTILNGKKAAKEVRAQLEGESSYVTCLDPVMVSVPGSRWSCSSISNSGGATEVAILFTDTDGSFGVVAGGS